MRHPIMFWSLVSADVCVAIVVTWMLRAIGSDIFPSDMSEVASFGLMIGLLAAALGMLAGLAVGVYKIK